MRKRIREKKARTVISIMLIAVMIFCAACSSSSNTGTEPEDITNVSDSEKNVTAAPEPASPTPAPASPTPVNDSPADNNAGTDNGKNDTGNDDVSNGPENDENGDPVAEDGDYTDDTGNTDYTEDPDYTDDSNDGNLPDYGTYAYKPNGQIPFFDELTLDSLFSSEAEREEKVDEIIQAHKIFCQEHGREYEPLDRSTVGTTPESLLGIYYKSGGEDEERVPFDQVEEWLVMFKGGVYAIYDKGFKHVMKSGALVSNPENDWQTFSVEEDGTANMLWEFNANDILCEDGYYLRAFELWDYDSENGGTSDSGNAGNTDDSDTSNDLGLYFSVDPMTEFFSMDTRLFGVGYKDFKKLLGISDLMQPEDWPWWGNNLKVVYVGDEYDTFACFFQNDSLVTVYRDSPGEGTGSMYYGATLEFGEPDSEYEYWNGTTAYEWTLKDFHYRQYTESYSEDDRHYRQQYMSYEFEE